MSRARLLTVLVGVLVALNVGLLAVMAIRMSAPGEAGRPAPLLRRTIPEALEFDAAQEARFDAEVDRHRAEMQELDRERRDRLRAWVATLSGAGGGPDAQARLERELQGLEGRRLAAVRGHFDSIRAMARPDQLARFPRVLDDAAGALVGPPPGAVGGAAPPRAGGPGRPGPGRPPGR